MAAAAVVSLCCSQLGGAGQHRALGLAKYPDCVGLVDRDENALVKDGIAVGIKQDKIGAAEARPVSTIVLASATVASGNLGIADDDLAHRPVELQHARLIHIDPQHVLLLGERGLANAEGGKNAG